MIGILGAMEIEIDGLVKRLVITRVKEEAGFKFIEGSLDKKKVVVCRCGIGKVASSVAATVMAITYPKITLIVNIGVAGGVYPSIKQGDVVISTNTVQHDWKSSDKGFGYVEGFDSPKLPCDKNAALVMDKVLTKHNVTHYLGTIVTGDQFISDRDKARWMYYEFDAYACDMESGAINHALKLLNKNFLSVRAISDNGDGSAVEDFYSFVETAAKRSIEAIIAFVAEL